MRNCTSMFEGSAVHLTTTGFNRTHRLCQIVVVHREGVEFFCRSEEAPFVACFAGRLGCLT